MRWNQIISTLTAVIFCFHVVLIPLAVMADPAPVIPETITTLHKGDSAPFDGTLFSITAAAKLVVDLQYNSQTCKLEKDKALELLSAEHKLKLDFKIAELEALQYKHDQILEIKTDQISFLESKMEPNVWYESGEFWFSMGVIGGILVTVAAGYAIGQASQ